MLRILFTLLLLVSANLAFAQSSASSRLVIISEPASSAAQSSLINSKSSVASAISSKSSVVATASSLSSSTASVISTKPVPLKLIWNTPIQYSDGRVMSVEEIAQFSLVYRLKTEQTWLNITILDKTATNYIMTLPDLDWEFRISVQSVTGLWSNQLGITPIKLANAPANSRPKLSNFSACVVETSATPIK